MGDCRHIAGARDDEHPGWVRCRRCKQWYRQGAGEAARTALDEMREAVKAAKQRKDEQP